MKFFLKPQKVQLVVRVRGGRENGKLLSGDMVSVLQAEKALKICRATMCI